MTHFSIATNTFFNNHNGVLGYTMAFSLQDKVKSNVRLYFYKYDLYDLVEIDFRNDTIQVFDFPHNKGRADFIKDDIEFYAGYFKSAGLYNHRFAYNINIKTPVAYIDFAPRDAIAFNNVHKEFLFTLDNLKDRYLTGLSAAWLFIATERTRFIDTCMLSAFNNSINIKKPKDFTLAGCMSAALLSGMLDGLGKNAMASEVDLVDADYKFRRSLNLVEFSSSNINNVRGNLKTGKFKRVIENALDVPAKRIKIERPTGSIALSVLVEQGLDKILKLMDDPREIIFVDIDVMHSVFTSAWISNGILSIEPAGSFKPTYFKELFESDNVQIILN